MSYATLRNKIYLLIEKANSSSGGGGGPANIIAGDTPIYCDGSIYEDGNGSLAPTGISYTVKNNGIYRFKWMASCEMSGGDTQTQLYKNGVAVGTLQSTSRASAYSLDLECNTGDIIELYFKSGSGYFEVFDGMCGGFMVCIDWDNGF